MALPSIAQIFSDFDNDGWRVSLREFLGYFVKQFWPGVSTQVDKLPFTRIDYPLVVLPFFLLAIIALFAFWERPGIRRGIFAGVTAGLLFYVYFNIWVYWTIVLGLLFCYSVFAGKKTAERMVPFCVLLLTLALVCIPFFVNFLHFNELPNHKDFLYRQWLSEGRELGLINLGFAYCFYFLIGGAVWWRYRKRDRKKAVLLLALILALFVVWNVQVVTGFVPAPDHWKRIASPVLFIVIALLLRDAVTEIKRSWIRYAIALVLIIAASLAVAKKVINVVSLWNGLQPWVAEKQAFPQELADSWQWIDANLPKESKIISSSSMTSQYLAVYTSSRPYVAYGILTPISTREIEDRFLKASRRFNVPEQVIRLELGPKENIPATCSVAPYCYDYFTNFSKTTFNLYGCYFSRGGFNTVLNRSCDVPADYIDGMIARYRNTKAAWDDIPADYVYYGPHERQFSTPDFGHDPQLTLVYKNPLVEIYKINHSPRQP